MLKKYFEILHYYCFHFFFFRLKIVQSTEVEMDSLKILASPSSPLLSIAKNPSGNQIVIFKTVKILISIVQPLMSHIDLNSLGQLVLLVMTNATSILLSMGAEVILVHPEGYPDIIRGAWSHLPFLAHLRVTTTLPRILLETILTLQKISTYPMIITILLILEMSKPRLPIGKKKLLLFFGQVQCFCSKAKCAKIRMKLCNLKKSYTTYITTYFCIFFVPFTFILLAIFTMVQCCLFIKKKKKVDTLITFSVLHVQNDLWCL